jgi:hypothetical protein
MERHASMYRLQELFVPAAVARLPFDPRISWNEYGVMTYFWPSPCARMKGLWVNVNEHEIMLSTGLSHTHVDEHDWDVRNDESETLLDRIVNQGVIQALNIINGETVFTKSYDPQGNEDSSSGMSPRWLLNDLDRRSRWRQFRGDGWTERAWDWQGEITDD